MSDWPGGINCSAAVSVLLRRLHAAGWLFVKQVGEYAEVVCGCGDGHSSRVILWPVVPMVLENTVRLLETNTCLGRQ